MSNNISYDFKPFGGTPIGSATGSGWPAGATTEKCLRTNRNTPSSTRMKRILFAGWGRVGKDEAAAHLAKITGLRYAGSFSWAALPYVAARLGQHPQVAWDTRHQNRKQWYDYCNDLRATDPTILARMVLANGDITAGIRDKVELEAVAAAHLFDKIIWVDRPGIPADPTVTYDRDHPAIDFQLSNHGSLEDFHFELRGMAKSWGML